MQSAFKFISKVFSWVKGQGSTCFYGARFLYKGELYKTGTLGLLVSVKDIAKSC